MYNPDITPEQLCKLWDEEDLSKDKIFIGIPTAGQPKLQCINSVLQLQKYLLKKNFAVIHKFYNTSMLSSNRWEIIAESLASQADYTLWVDDDMLFPPKAFDHLYTAVKKGCEIVGCNYPTRGFPHYFTGRHRDRGDRVATTLLTTGLVQVDFIGLGLCLMQTKILEDLPYPMFRMDERYGEDAFFFDKMYELKGVRPYISHDASKHVGHIAEKIITYAEGRANDKTNLILRQPTIEEMFGELQHVDDFNEFDELKHIRVNKE